MKLLIVFILTLSASLLGHSQASIKKMTIDELNSFINKNNKPLIISFWATWCASCVEEIPYFSSIVKEKFNKEVELVLVSLDLKDYYPRKITAFASKRNFNLPIIWLNESNADAFCPKIDSAWSGAIPSTLMVNNKKKYRKFYEQGLTAFQFEKYVQQLIQ